MQLCSLNDTSVIIYFYIYLFIIQFCCLQHNNTIQHLVLFDTDAKYRVALSTEHNKNKINFKCHGGYFDLEDLFVILDMLSASYSIN